ncbi:uncharacterized protein LOC130990954 [Salvia miltiorrhiza]|uniref:uncharacterized protein LOC130990954 n=1 Tax=Salvia miltiorrhiza TaxID=226208 RepID=UPI0025AC1E91|nr:uncharacterized protein LOC130990954 [Salvia miltiorrhiza]
MNNASANKESEDGGGHMQMKKVETVDFHTSAGQGQEPVRRVQVVHELQPQSALGPKTSGSILANAAASVVSTLESAKDAIQRK